MSENFLAGTETELSSSAHYFAFRELRSTICHRLVLSTLPCNRLSVGYFCFVTFFFSMKDFDMFISNLMLVLAYKIVIANVTEVLLVLYLDLFRFEFIKGSKIY